MFRRVARARERARARWITVPALAAHGFAFDWKFGAAVLFIYLVSMLGGHQRHHARPSSRVWRRPGRRTGSASPAACWLTVSIARCTATLRWFSQRNLRPEQRRHPDHRRRQPPRGLCDGGDSRPARPLPAVGRWITVLPPPVLGGLAMLMFGLVAVAGITAAHYRRARPARRRDRGACRWAWASACLRNRRSSPVCRHGCTRCSSPAFPRWIDRAPLKHCVWPERASEEETTVITLMGH